MNSRIYSQSILVLAVMIVCAHSAPMMVAQNSAPAPSPAPQSAPVQLSADVWDVLRLAQGKVSDATITAYIKNSGKVYSLGVSEIIYLREHGLSEQVLTTMLEQRNNVAATTAHPAQQPAQPSVWANSSSPQDAPAATQPAANYVQAAPVYTQPAPVYVYPTTYDYSWPYYGGYYGGYWGYPGISFSFGWGYGGHYGYHGGYHGGGGHYGGGYHGGGYSGGGHSGGGHSGGGGHH